MEIIILVHRNGKEAIKAFSSSEEEILFSGISSIEALWELGEKYPEAIIGWCEEKFLSQLALGTWNKIFHHDLIMASFAIETCFLGNQLGYVDRLPYINVNRSVRYGTWQMSTDMGGIKGKVLLKFKSIFKNINQFNYLLNSIGKLGQQNGLICYSDPGLINTRKDSPLVSTASRRELFTFIYQHYNSLWVSGLLLSFLIFQKSFLLRPYLQALLKRKFNRKIVDLSAIDVASSRVFQGEGIDVIIPTMGRVQYVHKVLKDLAAQTLLPTKVIIVEQNPDPRSGTQLPFLKEETWPFEIIHRFTHRVGVCNARNTALKLTTSEWVFLSDDDQRFGPDLLKSSLFRLKQYGTFSLTTSYLQPNEKKKFNVPKQWGTFGSGNSFVHRKFIEQVRFEEIFEYGYGEDVDFGMQLRNAGCDIFYDPTLEICHLKAPIGGFREEVSKPWGNMVPQPKPSPTLMAFIKKYYTKEQEKGYQLELGIRFYKKQDRKNPFGYIRSMKERWKISELCWENMNLERILKYDRE